MGASPARALKAEDGDAITHPLCVGSPGLSYTNASA